MANLTRFEPFADLAPFNPWGDVDYLFRAPVLRSLMRDVDKEPQLKIDVVEDDKAYRVKAEVPGVSKEDIKVAVNGNQVTISAEVKKEAEEKKGETVVHRERYYGRQSRTFTLMNEIDQNASEAIYKDGVLELTLPKKGGTPMKELSVK